MRGNNVISEEAECISTHASQRTHSASFYFISLRKLLLHLSLLLASLSDCVLVSESLSLSTEPHIARYSPSLYLLRTQRAYKVFVKRKIDLCGEVLFREREDSKLYIHANNSALSLRWHRPGGKGLLSLYVYIHI